MGKGYFSFKQFTIWQDQTAMKVCTDACIFGAWLPVENAHSVLDIGTGTGLLALMLAQRNAVACIDAVEIEPQAYQQAKDNSLKSPFADRVRVFHQAIQDFSPTHQYDWIICNPPFFSQHTPAQQAQRNIALHSQTLELDDLMRQIRRLLSPQGQFAVLLPPYQSQQLADLALQQGFFLNQQLRIFQYLGGAEIRRVQVFSQQSQPTNIQTLAIHRQAAAQPIYTDEFAKLLQPFYLYL
jgi:tRNA1Val (adenine37-N6)-methyltransferase